MNQRDNESPAFPLGDSCCEYRGTNRDACNGMTLRDYFAAKAMHAMIAGAHNAEAVALIVSQTGREPGELTAFGAYEYADAMLKARQA